MPRTRMAVSSNPGRKLVVAYQGTDGACSQIAAENHFEVEAITCKGFDTFRAMVVAINLLDRSAADRAVGLA